MPLDRHGDRHHPALIDAHDAARRALPCPPGFTLIELLIVTMIISLLAMLASVPVRQVRDRAMVTAAKQEVRQALTAVGMYEALNADLPREIGDLDDIGYHEGGGVVFCKFQFTAATRRRDEFITVEAKHIGAEKGITTRFPLDNGALTEKKLATCSDVRGGSGKGGKGGKGGKKKG